MTLVINAGPSTVFFGDNNAIRATDASGVVPITPNSYFGVTGDRDLYACVAAGTQSSLSIISGGLNFFLPLTSLTIPYGSTGERIVINPPDFPGSIVGYNPAGLIEFIISSNGYLLYDATGGALNHLFVAIQNAAGTESFGNPFAKGIQVGPQTGPQVLIAGGNPAFVSFPLNDAAFTSQPQINSAITPTGGTRFAQTNFLGPKISVASHTDSVALGLNSPNADGSSSANGEIDFQQANGNWLAWAFWDRSGMGIRVCQEITASDPTHVNTSASPAIAESWHDLRPLVNSFIGTVAGLHPPQYRKCADGDIEFFGAVQTPPTTGNYNGVTWQTIPAEYRPNHIVRIFAANVSDGASTPVLSVQANGNLAFNYLPTSLPQSIIAFSGRYPLDNTGVIQS
jgi:hypothetical protein